ncbi:MAG: hypothetical protein ACPGUV_14610, partial [Polyangiales bacterium]
ATACMWACGGAQSAPPTGVGAGAGSLQAQPSLAALPNADLPALRFSDAMRRGFDAAEQAFALDPPAPPTDQRLVSIQAWLHSRFAAWHAEKKELITLAHRLFDNAAKNSHHERVMAGAVVGLLYEDALRAFEHVPEPIELVRDPEVQAIFQRVLRHQQEPYRKWSQRAYHACALNARHQTKLQDWQRFCQGRKARLPGDVAPDEASDVAMQSPR